MALSQRVEAFLAVFFKEPGLLTEFCDPNITLHWRGQPLIKGLAELQTFAEQQMLCFEDFLFEVEDCIEQGDKVAVRLIQSGRLQGEWEGCTEIGAAFSVAETMFFHFSGQKIRHIWPLVDMEDKKRQLSAIDS